MNKNEAFGLFIIVAIFVTVGHIILQDIPEDNGDVRVFLNESSVFPLSWSWFLIMTVLATIIIGLTLSFREDKK